MDGRFFFSLVTITFETHVHHSTEPITLSIPSFLFHFILFPSFSPLFFPLLFSSILFRPLSFPLSHLFPLLPDLSTLLQAVGKAVVVPKTVWILVSEEPVWPEALLPSGLLTTQHNLLLVTPLPKTPHNPAPGKGEVNKHTGG